MRKRLVQRIQRFFILLSLTAIVIAFSLLYRQANRVDQRSIFSQLGEWGTNRFALLSQNILNPDLLNSSSAGPTVALIVGHAGHDSGAVCTEQDGEVTVREVDVNRAVANRVARYLRQDQIEVILLDEYDDRLEELQVDALLSIHADSCIDASGFKAARALRSVVIESDDRLVSCINQHYAATTSLVNHIATITYNMTGYHAFNRIKHETPAAILEIGFLGGDQALLTQEPGRVARGIYKSLRCFLFEEPV